MQDCLHLPRCPVGRDAYEGAVTEVLAPLVPDGAVERRSDEGTSVVATSIRPVFVILYEDRKA